MAHDREAVELRVRLALGAADEYLRLGSTPEARRIANIKRSIPKDKSDPLVVSVRSAIAHYLRAKTDDKRAFWLDQIKARAAEYAGRENQKIDAKEKARLDGSKGGTNRKAGKPADLTIREHMALCLDRPRHSERDARAGYVLYLVYRTSCDPTTAREWVKRALGESGETP